MTVQFAHLDEAQTKVLKLIVDRAEAMFKGRGEAYDGRRLVMDITAVCAHTPLDLDMLLAFSNLDFAHDVFGITNHMNRTTGQLMNGFHPRCAVQQGISK